VEDKGKLPRVETAQKKSSMAALLYPCLCSTQSNFQAGFLKRRSLKKKNDGGLSTMQASKSILARLRSAGLPQNPTTAYDSQYTHDSSWEVLTT
jgi:hypothetical protein